MIVELTSRKVCPGLGKPGPRLRDVGEMAQLVTHYKVILMLLLQKISEKLNVRLESCKVPNRYLEDLSRCSVFVTRCVDPTLIFHLL